MGMEYSRRRRQKKARQRRSEEIRYAAMGGPVVTRRVGEPAVEPPAPAYVERWRRHAAERAERLGDVVAGPRHHNSTW